MGHRKAIIHCSCANALYPAQAIQWDKCNFTRFSTNFIFEDFSWIDSVGHRKRSGGPHAAHGPAVGPRFSIKLADRFLAYLLYRALTWSTFKLLTLFLFFLSTTWSWTLLSIPPPSLRKYHPPKAVAFTRRHFHGWVRLNQTWLPRNTRAVSARLSFWLFWSQILKFFFSGWKAWLWKNIVWAACSLQISSDESLGPLQGAKNIAKILLLSWKCSMYSGFF